MDSIEITGKTVDEALASALTELNQTKENVDVEILEEAKEGLFGLFGSRKAKIKVTVKVPLDNIKEIDNNIKNISEASKSKNEFIRKTVIQNNEESINFAKNFLQQIFNSMKINVVMEKFINKDDGTVTFKLYGDDMGILIGKHGQTLDSLQYLTSLVANKNSSERIRIMIDIENYRERRAQTLTKLSLRLADKVKKSGERVVLEPMNPHERKIIHMALQNDSLIKTVSEGEDPYRKVAIELKK